MGEVRNIKLNLNIKNQNSGKLTVGPAVVEENVQCHQKQSIYFIQLLKQYCM